MRFAIRTRLNRTNFIDCNTLKWCVNQWQFSQRYLSDTRFLNSPLTNVTRYTKPNHIARNSRPKNSYTALSNVFFMRKCPKIRAHRGSTVGFLLLQCSSGVVRYPRDLQVSVATRSYRVLIFASS